MVYVNFVSLAELVHERNRAFVAPLHTACGLFKLSLKKKALTLVAALELSSPTFNGSEQFPWILANVGIRLKIASRANFEVGACWTFTSCSRTWKNDFMSCAEFYKLSRSPCAAAVASNWIATRHHPVAKFTTAAAMPHAGGSGPPEDPPSLEIHIMLPPSLFQVFTPLNHNAAIHTSSHYRNLHRALHCILLTQHLLEDDQPPDPCLKKFFMQALELRSCPSVFHQLLSYISQKSPAIVEADMPEILEHLAPQLVRNARRVLRVADWEGHTHSIKLIIQTCRHPQIVVLRLNQESGFLKTCMKRSIIHVPMRAEVDKVRFICQGVSLSFGRHESNLFRISDSHWLRVSDHSYDVTETSFADTLVCHKKFLPTTLIYVAAGPRWPHLAPSPHSALAGVLDAAVNSKPIVTGLAAAGGLSLVSALRHDVSANFDLISHIKDASPQACYAVVPWLKLSPIDLKALRELLKMGGSSCAYSTTSRCVEDSDKPSCASTTSSEADTTIGGGSMLCWFRLASLLSKHVGYAGVLWADSLVHHSLPTEWSPTVARSLFSFKTRTESLRKQKRGARGVGFASADQKNSMTPAGKRRRLPSQSEAMLALDETLSAAIAAATVPTAVEAPAAEADVDLKSRRRSAAQPERVANRYSGMVRHVFASIFAGSDIYASLTEERRRQCSVPTATTIRLSFEFDPAQSYLISISENLTTKALSERLATLLSECARLFTEELPPWLLDLMRSATDSKATLSLWRRHGLTWRQILPTTAAVAKTVRAGCSREVLCIIHTASEPAVTITETLLDVYCLDQYTFEPVHVGYATSQSNQTVAELYQTKVAQRHNMLTSLFECTTAEGQQCIESWPVRRLRMSQGALYFSAIVPVTVSRRSALLSARRHFLRSGPALLKNFLFRKRSSCTSTSATGDGQAAPVPVKPAKPRQPPAVEAKPRRNTRTGAPSQPQAVASQQQQLDHMWAEFMAERLQSSEDIERLAELLKNNKVRAVRCLDQIKTVDARVCDLMQHCGEALVPSMSHLKSASRRANTAMRNDSVAQNLAGKLRACLVSAACKFDQKMCDRCIAVIGIMENDDEPIYNRGGLAELTRL